MVRERFKSPYSLFTHALDESDWVLAALIARSLEGDRLSRDKLTARLRRASRSSAAMPASLNALRRWSEIATAIGIAGESK